MGEIPQSSNNSGVQPGAPARIIGEEIAPGNAEYFAPFSDDDRAAFFSAFAGLRLSRQMQREFAEWLPEIACRDRRTIREILASDEIAAILQNQKINPPQRIAMLRDALFRMRFPTYTAALEIWRKTADSVNPDRASVHFEPSPGFEKDRLEIKVTVTDPKKAHEILKQLAGIPEDTWKVLINPFHGPQNS